MYHYEVLGDERFQEFCQALIVAEHPNAQCLPVGQPDGGRDAFAYRRYLAEREAKTTTRELIVFQVKFVRRPLDSRDEREMIEEVVSKEKQKIERLKASGIDKYYLITNLRGTSHLETGSIDRVNKLLSEMLGIEAYCWWRDDLDRRLDNNSSVKWSYTDILKASDLLEQLVKGQLGEGEERRHSAIRAYMTSQYDEDQELRFKQTELRGTMTDLFVDLPMSQSVGFDIWESPRFRRYSHGAGGVDLVYRRETYPGRGHEGINSAEFFLTAPNAERSSRIILEGAPGQGKSTVTQFVCQVMRMRLLDRHEQLGSLPEQYQRALARIPFRVDLRDLAKWINGVDPFQPKRVELEDEHPRSLEGFLAGQVRFVSGGHTFDVSDLTAVARASHIFLALDGFDEVADVALRRALVEEITKGVSRLRSAGGFSVQAVVTSRPAAFAKSVRFSRQDWDYLELLPLERRQVDDYTTKWMRAKGLKEAEKVSLRHVLDAKLTEAHTQYLAKNPMQLTILLSLINNRGASLPEKRTAMYDAYMDMFFSRESEKSEVVRDNRELLVDIHRFLAWKLQTAAENGGNGSIEQSELRTILFSYLDRAQEDTSIVDALFDGIIERVGALVSRVQETYEFEVQPLREYFAARHLYETAPYLSGEADESGDKFDRFIALIRNPYWLNVARFYGGCFNKGEILTLVNELIELAASDPYKRTTHGRSIALILLSDWVFTQYQPAVKQVVSFICEWPYLRQLLAITDESEASVWSSLPDRSGRVELVELLWKRLKETKQADERRALSDVIVQNSSLDDRWDRWMSLRDSVSHGEWARLGNLLRLLRSPESHLSALIGDVSDDLIFELISANRFDFLASSQETSEATRRVALARPRVGGAEASEDNAGSPLAWLVSMCGHYQYTIALSGDAGSTLRHAVRRRFAPELLGLERTKIPIKNISEAELAAIGAYSGFLNAQLDVLSTTVTPWIELVEAMRRAWGDCRAIDRIAFLGAGVRCREAGGLDGPLEGSADLVSSARYVRLKSGAPRWWEHQLAAAADQTEQRRLLLLLGLWATPKTMAKIANTVAPVLDKLSPMDWSILMGDFRAVFAHLGPRDSLDGVGEVELRTVEQLGARLCSFFGQRLPLRPRARLAERVASAEIIELPEAQFAMDTLLRSCTEPNRWKIALPMVKSLYDRGATGRYVRSREASLPSSVASRISETPENYPLSLVAFADISLRSKAGEAAPKLSEVARQESWFVE